MTGQRFGSLVVLAEAGRNKQQLKLWRCACDCGREAVVVGCSMRSGNTRSCGCGMAQARYQQGEANRNWKGDAVSVQAARERARRWFTAPPRCSIDGCAGVPERHHIDGNTRNNDPSNIQFVCHRHHMQIELCGKPKPEAMRRAISRTLTGRKPTEATRIAQKAGLRAWWARRKAGAHA